MRFDAEPWVWAEALAWPIAAVIFVLVWAASLRRRGRFAGGIGFGHGLGRHFDGARAREIALDIAALGSSTLVTVFTFVAAVFWWRAGGLRQGLLLASAVVLAAALGRGLKRVTRRLRPGEATAVFFGSSFPSSHTLMGSTLYGTAAMLWVQNGPAPLSEIFAAVAAALLALLIGLSRVVLRVHYLSDVAAGWLLAAALVRAVAVLNAAGSPIGG